MSAPTIPKGKFWLEKFVMKWLHARGMIAQEGREWLFAPALAAHPDLRAAGSTEDLAAAAELTQAGMLQQVEELQRHLAAVRASVGEPRNPGAITISDYAFASRSRT